GRAAPKLEGIAEEQAWRTVAGRSAFQKETDRIPGGARAIGRELLDEKLVAAGDRLEDVAPKVEKAREAAGSAVGEMLDRADQAGVAAPSVASIRGRVEKDVLSDLRKMKRTNAGPIGQVE